jgi:2-oxoglutarate ferredoxin oxidoreductase subunit alpha
MSSTQVKERPQASEQRPKVVNDFSIVVATVNGSGSQTSNAALVHALFHMGIPVSAKNLFPSNIKGLPTWYTIRASKDGYVARSEVAEILVAFNAKTQDADLRGLPPGGVCIFPDDSGLERTRDDVVYYALPVKEILKQGGIEPKFRDRMINMVYVGALAQLLGIELTHIKSFLDRHFGGKERVVEPNMRLVEATAAWARESLPKVDPYRVEQMDATRDMILIEGNAAAALGAIFGGVGVVAWYPITPATTLADALMEHLPKLRIDAETSQATFAMIQSEDELAALGMVLGAGWAGARAMTSTSGPGISLMAEFTGFGYFAEIPGVIWDIQRMGPSTGLPTRTSQGDLISTYYLSHGDARHVILLPGSVNECFEYGWKSFDIAERLQTPVFVLSDLDFGMNLWMADRFEYPDTPMDRGKVLTADDVKKLGGAFLRYRDENGDGIGPRTLPGVDTPGAAYFTRGTGHTEAAHYSERPEDWKANMDRLDRKFETARKLVPKPVTESSDGADAGLLVWGSSDPAVVEARDLLRSQGLETGYLRLRALPFEQTTREFLAAHSRIYVVEANQHGQLATIIRAEFPEYATRIRSVNLCDGLPLTASFVASGVTKGEQSK